MCVYIHNSLNFKVRHDLSICDEDSESLCVELINKNCKNILINTIYRPPAGKIKPFKRHLKDLFSKNSKSNKKMYLAGDFNLNVLDFECNTKFNLLFQHCIIPVTNKATRITKKSVTTIDHILTNNFLNNDIKTGIIKSDISDHFPIFLISNKSDIDLHVVDSTTIFKVRDNWYITMGYYIYVLDSRLFEHALIRIPGYSKQFSFPLDFP